MYSGIPIVNMVMFIACAMNLLLIVLFYYINFAADGKNFLKNLLFYWVFIIFGGISYENWWSTNLCEDNPFVFDNKFTLTR